MDFSSSRLPPELDPLPQLLAQNGWTHTESNCWRNGFYFCSRFANKQKRLSVLWNRQTFQLISGELQLNGNINELTKALIKKDTKN